MQVNFYIKEKFKDPSKLTQSQISKIGNVAKYLEEGYPRDYLIGNSEFYGRKFFVDQRVLIPRMETEVLIDTIKELNLSDGSILCDLGTGSGCIGISLAMLNESFIVFGVEISEEAILVARKNDLTYMKKNFFLIQSNWASCFQENSIDCIISNPPYICKKEQFKMAQNVTDFEPHLALFVDDNSPLIFYDAIKKIISLILNSNGLCFLEIKALPTPLIQSHFRI